MFLTSSHGQVGRGLWNCPRATQYSKETQEMLKLMMQESRLSNFQQRQINQCLQKGAALPLSCNPRSSVPPTQPRPQPGPGGLPAKPLRRSAESCRSGNSYSREKFRPSVTRDLEKEKRRLQSILATGQEEPEPRSAQTGPADQNPEVVQEKDRFQEVLDEIEDRRQFLADMTALGQGKNYYSLINTEISQKIQELKVIDKARSAEMTALMTMSERKVASTEQMENTDSEETGTQN
ncbi:UPF0193 protein EVG1 [Diretmus argenteus]